MLGQERWCSRIDETVVFAFSERVTNGRTDTPSYRAACTRLKREVKWRIQSLFVQMIRWKRAHTHTQTCAYTHMHMHSPYADNQMTRAVTVDDTQIREAFHIFPTTISVWNRNELYSVILSCSQYGPIKCVRKHTHAQTVSKRFTIERDTRQPGADNE